MCKSVHNIYEVCFLFLKENRKKSLSLPTHESDSVSFVGFPRARFRPFWTKIKDVLAESLLKIIMKPKEDKVFSDSFPNKIKQILCLELPL